MNTSGRLEALALTIDPAQAREAARRWRGCNRYGLTVRPAQLIVGLVYIALGIGGLVIIRPPALTSMQAIASTVFVALGLVSALQGIGRFDFQPRPLIFETIELDDRALVISDERGIRRSFAWQAVKSVQRTDDALVFVLSWRRALVVPAAALGGRQGTLWPQLYAHLVSRRSLNATPVAHVSEIVNTAFT
jgi:hypothetical protein